tara:strand:- start:59 stop:445 length:387 start_codon:yes stop_codon:yes gene_type:complete
VWIAKKILSTVVALPAILFVVMGLRWLVNPGGIAPELGLTIESGVGLSTQIGDLSAFFLTIGLCILTALVTGRRTWFYPPIVLLLITAVGRIVAWLVHDAALALSLIAPEIVIAMLLLVAAKILPEKD